jgi:methionyl aminopeptidase
MILLKTISQLEGIRAVNKIGAEFLSLCYDYIKPGIQTLELEELAIRFCNDNHVVPSFYKFNGFPHRLCVSVNDEVVHGFPSDRVIKDGDIVSIDFGVIKDGYYSDAAFTKSVGLVKPEVKDLVETTKECLYRGIEASKVGNRIQDISKAIQSHTVHRGFDVIRDYVGHGVGLYLHEAPKIYNYVFNATINWRLLPGMVIAIEPMLVNGSYDTEVGLNGWTVLTRDHSLSAHFEHSIAISEEGPEILSVC